MTSWNGTKICLIITPLGYVDDKPWQTLSTKPCLSSLLYNVFSPENIDTDGENPCNHGPVSPQEEDTLYDTFNSNGSGWLPWVSNVFLLPIKKISDSWQPCVNGEPSQNLRTGSRHKIWETKLKSNSEGDTFSVYVVHRMNILWVFAALLYILWKKKTFYFVFPPQSPFGRSKHNIDVQNRISLSMLSMSPRVEDGGGTDDGESLLQQQPQQVCVCVHGCVHVCVCVYVCVCVCVFVCA